MSTTNPNSEQHLGPGGTDPVGGLRDAQGFPQLVAQSRKAGFELAGQTDSREYEAAVEAVHEIRTNAQLRKDEWVSLDENLVNVAQDELMVVNDLRSRGLTVNEDLSTLIREFEKRDEFSAADIDMEPETAASEDTFQFTIDGIPLPIVHKSYHIPYRKLLASRERGQALDTSMQEAATRVVAEQLETLVFNGWTTTVGGYDVPGMTTETNRNTGNGEDWDDLSGTSADDIRADVLEMIEGLENDNYNPPYVLYLDRASYQALRARDTGTDQERGLLERLREEFSAELDAIRSTNYLDSGEGVMFAPRSDVIELAVAADMQNVEWSSNGGWRTHHKVLASITPIVKSDASSQSGIFHMSSLLS